MQTAKATFYNPNGSGRDTYIYSDNGGFTVAHQPSQQPPIGTSFLPLPLLIGTFGSPSKHPIAVKRPVINSKTLNYHSDGTGRDSYIV